jgi:GNAT superfamily N-acetyltransferase
MMSKLKYGAASVADLPRIVDMKIAMFYEAGHGDLLTSDAESVVLKDYLSLYEKKLACHFVAQDGQTLVASVGAFVKNDLPFRYFEPPRYGFLGDVYTEDRYRGIGIATTLSTHALNWLKLRNIRMVRLFASEAARPIYESLGFTNTDEMALQLET